MCNTTNVFQQQQSAALTHGSFKSALPPPFALSTFHLLRNCNRLILSNSGQLILPDETATSYYHAKTINESGSTAYNMDTMSSNVIGIGANAIETLSNCTMTTTTSSSTSGEVINVLDEEQEHENATTSTTTTTTAASPTNAIATIPSINANIDKSSIFRNFNGSINSSATSAKINKTPLPAFEYIAPAKPTFLNSFTPFDMNRLPGMFPSFMQRRTRGEKRTIPDELKDEKYFERRKRNNEAAKKSRDARKIREDRNAFRAALLEQENSILRAQVLTLRDELATLKQLIAATTTTTHTSSLLGKGLL